MKLLFRALGNTFKYYGKIMPHFIVLAAFYIGIQTFIPLVGWFLALPMLVGFAYTSTYVVLSGLQVDRSPYLLGYDGDNGFKNIFYLGLRSIIISIIIGGAILLTGAIFESSLGLLGRVLRTDLGTMLQETLFSDILIILIVIAFMFALPGVLYSIVSSMFSMVPYLLADPKFNQRWRNPLITSMKMLKGHYIKLILLRFLFMIWYIWMIIGGIFSGILMLFMAFSGSGERFVIPFVNSWLLSVPVTLFLILPWYHMLHTTLYVDIRDKIIIKKAHEKDMSELEETFNQTS